MCAGARLDRGGEAAPRVPKLRAGAAPLHEPRDRRCGVRSPLGDGRPLPGRAASRQEITGTLWPWLKERGYADDDDDATLELFLDTKLGRRPAYLRPGLRLKRRWDIEAVQAVGGLGGLAAEVRADVNAILAAAGEPPLPTADTEPRSQGETTPAPLSTSESPQEQRLHEQVSGAPIRRREPIAEHVRHEVWRRDQGRCVDCGSRERLEFDHIIPISKGGSNTARNLELRCQDCNRRKAAHI